MKYINSLYLPSDHQETGFLMSQRRTCYNGYYPCKIFPQKGLSEINFAPITIFYDLDSDPVKTSDWTELENVRRYFDFFEEHRNEFL